MTPDLPDVSASLVAYATEVCRAVRVEVGWLGLDPARLPAGGVPMWSGDPCRAHPELKLIWGQGDDVDVLTVRPRLGVWVPARIASAPAGIGELILVVDGTARIEDLDGVLPVGDLVATTAIQTGDVVSATNARVRPDAAAGGDVTLRVRVGSLVITAPGRLLDAARIGGDARAQNLATDTIVRGTLIDADTVEL